MAARAATAANCVTFSLEHFELFAERVGRQEEEWLLLECTEVLRSSAQEGDLLAYLGEGRFVWLCLEQDESRIRSSLAAQEADLALKFLRRGHAISLRYRIGIAPLDENVNWNLVSALELAEQQSWPAQHLPAPPALRSLALQ
jgi:GGDEF domain-containing protein